MSDQEYRLSDLWDAYRRGAHEMREIPEKRATDEQIERACDAYCKLVYERKAANATYRKGAVT